MNIIEHGKYLKDNILELNYKTKTFIAHNNDYEKEEIELNMDELQAIYKKCQELGWI